jgi:hypothetical protein
MSQSGHADANAGACRALATMVQVGKRPSANIHAGLTHATAAYEFGWWVRGLMIGKRREPMVRYWSNDPAFKFHVGAAILPPTPAPVSSIAGFFPGSRFDRSAATTLGTSYPTILYLFAAQKERAQRRGQLRPNGC